jgi:hypothetical protein
METVAEIRQKVEEMGEDVTFGLFCHYCEVLRDECRQVRNRRQILVGSTHRDISYRCMGSSRVAVSSFITAS